MTATLTILAILVLSTLYLAAALAQQPESPPETADSPAGD